MMRIEAGSAGAVFRRIVVPAAGLLLGSGCGTPPGGGGDGGGSGGGTPTGSVLMRFASIGDYGDDDDNTRAVAEMVKGWDPNFIVTVGDNDYSDGAFRGTFTALEAAVGQFYHEFIGNYQGSEGAGSAVNRFFPTPGDHDWGDTCDDPEGLDDYLAYFTLPGEGASTSDSGNERYYDFVQGPVHFFAIHGLDGCEPDGVSPDSVQGRWVRETALASTSTFKVAYFHKAPYSSGARHIDEGAFMRWPFDEWGFDLVMSGDDHIYERLEVDGVTYLVNGLGGIERHEFVDTPRAESLVRFADDHGAVMVDVYEDALSVSFRTVGGMTVDSFTIFAAGVGGGGGSGGGTSGDLDPNVAPVTEGDWYKPAADAAWQWQLQPNAQGEINTSYSVDVYDVDLFDVPDAAIDAIHADGGFLVCYFSAGTFEDFRSDSGEFAAAELGSNLGDFPDERWLDVRSVNVRRIMEARLDLAVTRGCDAVEPDNVDGFANASGFDFTATDQLAYNKWIANAARSRGLGVGLKNDLDQVEALLPYFDFAVNEQCHEFSECELLEPFLDAGKPVFSAEYASQYVNDAAARAAMCAEATNRGLATLVLPIDLDDSFRFSCD